MQRGKARDYYDVWRMAESRINRSRVREILRRKLRAKNIPWPTIKDIFPPILSKSCLSIGGRVSRDWFTQYLK